MIRNEQRRSKFLRPNKRQNHRAGALKESGGGWIHSWRMRQPYRINSGCQNGEHLGTWTKSRCKYLHRKLNWKGRIEFATDMDKWLPPIRNSMNRSRNKSLSSPSLVISAVLFPIFVTMFLKLFLPMKYTVSQLPHQGINLTSFICIELPRI